MCPRAGLNAVEKGKNSCPCRESDPGCLARSLVPRLTELPRLSYYSREVLKAEHCNNTFTASTVHSELFFFLSFSLCSFLSSCLHFLIYFLFPFFLVSFSLPRSSFINTRWCGN